MTPLSFLLRITTHRFLFKKLRVLKSITVIIPLISTHPAFRQWDPLPWLWKGAHAHLGFHRPQSGTGLFSPDSWFLSFCDI